MSQVWCWHGAVTLWHKSHTSTSLGPSRSDLGPVELLQGTQRGWAGSPAGRCVLLAHGEGHLSLTVSCCLSLAVPAPALSMRQQRDSKAGFRILCKLWQVKDNDSEMFSCQALLEVCPCSQHPPKSLTQNELPPKKIPAHIPSEICFLTHNKTHLTLLQLPSIKGCSKASKAGIDVIRGTANDDRCICRKHTRFSQMNFHYFSFHSPGKKGSKAVPPVFLSSSKCHGSTMNSAGKLRIRSLRHFNCTSHIGLCASNTEVSSKEEV